MYFYKPNFMQTYAPHHVLFMLIKRIELVACEPAVYSVTFTLAV